MLFLTCVAAYAREHTVLAGLHMITAFETQNHNNPALLTHDVIHLLCAVVYQSVRFLAVSCFFNALSHQCVSSALLLISISSNIVQLLVIDHIDFDSHVADNSCNAMKKSYAASLWLASPRMATPLPSKRMAHSLAHFAHPLHHHLRLPPLSLPS